MEYIGLYIGYLILINRNGPPDSEMEKGKTQTETETDLTEIVKFDSSSLGRLRTSLQSALLSSHHFLSSGGGSADLIITREIFQEETLPLHSDENQLNWDLTQSDKVVAKVNLKPEANTDTHKGESVLFKSE